MLKQYFNLDGENANGPSEIDLGFQAEEKSAINIQSITNLVEGDNKPGE